MTTQTAPKRESVPPSDQVLVGAEEADIVIRYVEGVKSLCLRNGEDWLIIPIDQIGLARISAPTFRFSGWPEKVQEVTP